MKRDEKGRFIKGQSGNPGGRPHVSITKVIQDKLEEGETLQDLCDRIMKMALGGNEQMIKYIWERMDGKLKETVDLNADIKVANFAEWVKRTQEEDNE